MTNLTSEQYRDVIKNVPNSTELVPSVQHLLRKAVETFFTRFGGYPEIAGVAPGTIGILGEQTQFDGGMSIPTATQMATIIVGRKAAGPRFAIVTSADVGKPHKVLFSFSRNRPLAPGCPEWLNYVKGVIDNYKGGEVPPFEAAIESSIPVGVGFGSSSAFEIATYTFLEVLVGNRTDPVDKAIACQEAEKNFAGKTVGLMDGIASIKAKDRHVMLVDCQKNEVQWIPFQNKDIAFVAVDTHVKHKSVGNEYEEGKKYIAKACKMLGVDTLRKCTEDDLINLETKINQKLKKMDEENSDSDEEKKEGNDEEDDQIKGEEESEDETETEEGSQLWSKEDYMLVLKRARFFITEMKRINEAIEAWNEKDTDTFGEKMKESHKSLKDDFDCNNPLLDFLVETSLQVEGVLGSRMTGTGVDFGGGIVTLIKKENVATYCEYIRSQVAEKKEQLQEELLGVKQKLKEKEKEANKISRAAEEKRVSDEVDTTSLKIQKIQEDLENGKVSPRKLSVEEKPTCLEKRRKPCILKVVRKPGGCRSRRQEDEYTEIKKENEYTEEKKEKKEKRVNEEKTEEKYMLEEKAEETESEEESLESNLSLVASEASKVSLNLPTFYMLSPFAGARMMFVTKPDILRSIFSVPIPHPKALIKSALEQFKSHYNNKPTTIAVAPATVVLFGEFMEYHLGYLVCMGLPMITVVVGGRNDSVYFSFKTTSTELDEETEMKSPLPSVRQIRLESRLWVNYVSAIVSEFKGHVPGFNALIHSSAPIRLGMNTCAALQASIYTFLENLTHTFTEDPFEKANLCGKTEYEFTAPPSELFSRCSQVKFFPTFLCKEGHLMFINCRSYKISHYFFDNPSYAFLIATCKKNTSDVTMKSLDERLDICRRVIECLGRNSLLSTDLRHLECLRYYSKATDEMKKRARYAITEHERTMEAVRAIKNLDYARVGMLMNQSHDSLRDDYEVSSPEIEDLIALARSCDGVLGAKMLGRGISASIIILIKLSEADKCIRYMRENYKEKNDKPVFYITQPSQGTYAMDPETEVDFIP